MVNTLELGITSSAKVQITETEAKNFYKNLLLHGSVNFGNTNFNLEIMLEKKYTNVKQEAESLMTDKTSNSTQVTSGINSDTQPTEDSYFLERVSKTKIF